MFNQILVPSLIHQQILFINDLRSNLFYLNLLYHIIILNLKHNT